MSWKRKGPIARAGRFGLLLAVVAYVGLYLHDNYPGLYVLFIALLVCVTIWLWVSSTRTAPEQTLAEHHERELARTEDDSALLAELKVMFASRACDWPMMSAVTHPGKLCPDCGHSAFHHDVPTKVCEKCHARPE